jgi:hypothetical protein
VSTTHPNDQQDALTRINSWIDRLENLAAQLLAVIQPADLDSAKAVDLLLKCENSLTRHYELRQQFTTENTSSADLLLPTTVGPCVPSPLKAPEAPTSGVGPAWSSPCTQGCNSRM